MSAEIYRANQVSMLLIGLVISLTGLLACESDQNDKGMSTPEEFIQSLAIELETSNPNQPFDDLEELGDIFADKIIVLFGEGDHGIKEAFEYKLRLTAYLYHEHGFNVHAYEIGVGEGLLIDEYLQTGDVSKIEDLDIFDYQSFASTDEHVAFLEALQNINRNRSSGSPPLRYRGFDLDHGRRNAKELVIAYITAAGDAELLSTLTPLISCIDSTEECAAQQGAAIDGFDAARNVLVAASTPEDFELYRGVLVNLGDTVQYYLMAVKQEPGADSFREQAMMRNFDVLGTDDSEKVIVSAHNMHIARTMTQEGSGWWKMLGQHLVETRGEDSVYGLCMTFYQGAHLTRDSNWVFSSEPVDDVPKMYLEDYLIHADLDRYVLDFSTATPGDPASGWLFRKIGMLFNGYANSFFVAPAKQWDGVLFVKTVSSSRQR